MKVLLVEDEPSLSASILSYFTDGEIISESASSFMEAEDRILSFTYDIVVLDIMLPDGNGLELLRLLKKTNPETGVLIISAQNALDDRIKGLELGADDYLTKPFALPELNARLKAIFRRSKFQGRRELIFHEITLNTDTFEVAVNNEPIVLTVKEYELLLFFIANKNRVLTRQSIAEHLWGDQVDLMDSYDFVYQHVKNLRKKITSVGGEDYLKTIYGLGYRWTDNK
jgi:DNA-binding response OmpR family regulator